MMHNAMLLKVTKDLVKAIAQDDKKAADEICTQLRSTFNKAKGIVEEAKQPERIDSIRKEIYKCVGYALYEDVLRDGLYSPKPFLYSIRGKSYPLAVAIDRGTEQDAKRAIDITNTLEKCISVLNAKGVASPFFFMKNMCYTMPQLLHRNLVEGDTGKYNPVFFAMNILVLYPKKTNLINTIANFCRVIGNDTESLLDQEKQSVLKLNMGDHTLTVLDYLCAALGNYPAKSDDHQRIQNLITQFVLNTPALLNFNFSAIARIIQTERLDNLEFYLKLMAKSELSFTPKQLSDIRDICGDLKDSSYVRQIFDEYQIEFPEQVIEDSSSHVTTMRRLGSYSESNGQSMMEQTETKPSAHELPPAEVMTYVAEVSEVEKTAEKPTSLGKGGRTI